MFILEQIMNVIKNLQIKYAFSANSLNFHTNYINALNSLSNLFHYEDK